MKCPHCKKEIPDEQLAKHLAGKGGRKSKRTITPEQQAKLQAARKMRMRKPNPGSDAAQHCKHKMKKKSAYSRKGLLIEIFRKEAESQNNRKPKCYNDAAMSTKPQVGYSKAKGKFTVNGDPITDEYARELWDAGASDWTQAAFREMSKRVMEE